MTMILATDALCRPAGPAPGSVLIEGDRIVGVAEGCRADATETVDGILVPGFVDIQVNGHATVDFASAGPEHLRSTARHLAKAGTTTFLATLVSRPLDRYEEILGRLAVIADGIHLEGPFLGGAPGAHDPSMLEAVNLDWLLDLVERFPIRMVTLAPEADAGNRATRALAARGVLVALGHTTASYESMVAATDAGARAATHVFNAMAPFHHRAPGPVGAALDDDRLTCTLISDLLHVHPAALRIAIGASAATALVSDEVATTIAPRAGTPLMGSRITLAAGVANLVGVGVPLGKAVAMASSVPSRLCGFADRGRIESGARADLLLLDSATLAVHRVWKAGVEI